jgi:hypothetical protein
MDHGPVRLAASAVYEESAAHGDETSCGQFGDSVPDFPLVDAG